MVDVSRRGFLQGALGGAGAMGLGLFGFDERAAAREVAALKISNANETRTICPYCAVGCSMIAYTIGGAHPNSEPVLVHIEGDPDSPINAGSLCPKGASAMQLAVNQQRPTDPMYRAPGAKEWQVIDWDEAMTKMATWMKSSRDAKFEAKDDAGYTVNRHTGFAFLGGATISNEEGFLTAKLFRGLGTVYLEQQARV